MGITVAPPTPSFLCKVGVKETVLGVVVRAVTEIQGGRRPASLNGGGGG